MGTQKSLVFSLHRRSPLSLFTLEGLLRSVRHILERHRRLHLQRTRAGFLILSTLSPSSISPLLSFLSLLPCPACRREACFSGASLYRAMGKANMTKTAFLRGATFQRLPLFAYMRRHRPRRRRHWRWPLCSLLPRLLPLLTRICVPLVSGPLCFLSRLGFLRCRFFGSVKMAAERM